MNAVDTNVYVYALDPDEPVKQAKAVDLFDRLAQPPTDTILLWQVAAELLNQLRKWESAGHLTATASETAFERFRTLFPLKIPSESVFKISFELRSRFSLSHWDSMILAACKEAGVTTLLSKPSMFSKLMTPRERTRDCRRGTRAVFPRPDVGRSSQYSVMRSMNVLKIALS